MSGHSRRGGKDLSLPQSSAQRRGAFGRAYRALGVVQGHLSDLLVQGGAASHPEDYALADELFNQIEAMRRRLYRRAG